MAETLISPGVFLNENDQTQITAGPISAGAAILGPTVLGPVNNPTLVTSYSQYKQIFGTTFVSGGVTLEYLTSVAALNYFNQGGASLLVTRVASGSYTVATASIASTGGPAAFQLNTLSVGTIMNNAISGSTVSQGSLISGSAANVRWEIVGYNTGSGQFTLNIRRGDDYENNKNVLESWSGLSLDPNQTNFISYVIGDQYQTLTQDASTGAYYLQNTGSYANKSKYVYVASVNTTPNYFDQTGRPQNQYTASLPQSGSGSYNGGFGGAVGAFWGSYGLAPLNMFENIPNITSTYTQNATNVQGVYGPDYDTAISLLANQVQYDFNLIYAPGLTNQNAPTEINSLLNLSSNRGDNISVVDLVGYNQQLATVTTAAQSFDNSYGATYWPWIQIKSAETGRMNFIPASVLVPAVYEYNDKIAAEWWAPAGLNRGGLATALQPERRLSLTDRNNLYAAKVNPIATFTGVGTVIYGQKTLQAKATALDRVNVRRLLISLKRYIKQIGQTLVFEPNTQVTWNKFVNQVNPYLESVQQKQGLYAFQVIMDSTNNTPDQIDRNILVGSIYLQPTRVAEFIQLDFNILPTGATFAQ